jgi:hypothetical protein
MVKVEEAELIAWIRTCDAYLRDARAHEVLSDHANEFLLLYGLIARSTRYAAAYATLLDAGAEAEAVPLARVAIEHAITLQWVFTTVGGIDRLRTSVAHDRNDHYRQLAKWMDNETLRTATAALEAPPAGRRLGKFQDMLRDLDHKHFLESRYNLLSQQVHVTHSAVTGFIDAQQSELGITYEQNSPYRSVATHIAALAATLARWVLARLTNDEAMLSELSDVSDLLQLPIDLSDQLPPAKKRVGI